MVKKDIIRKIAHQTGVPKWKVEIIINSFLGSIVTAVSRGETVTIAKFGVFEPKLRAANTGLNPHTKEIVYIPQRFVPSFRAGQFFKDALAELNEKGE